MILLKDIYYEVFQYLDAVDIYNLMTMNTKYYAMISQSLWKVQYNTKQSQMPPSGIFNVFKLTIDAFHLDTITLGKHLRELVVYNYNRKVEMVNYPLLRKLSMISCKDVVIDLPLIEQLNIAYSNATIIDCRSVYHLDISSTNIREIPYAPKLKNLYLDDTCVKTISHIPNLQVLSLEETYITELPDCSTLNHLNISRTSFTESYLLTALKNACHLNQLEMEGLIITSLILECLIRCNCPMIELNLNDTSLYSHDILYLIKNSNVEALSLDNTKVDDQLIDHLLQNPFKLTYLSLLDIKLTPNKVKKLSLLSTMDLYTSVELSHSAFTYFQ